MKGQFFISSIVVIAVILIVSLAYANSSEELRIESGTDLEFDNYKNAYGRSVPDNWVNINFDTRRKIGICVSDTSETDYVNTSINITPKAECNDIYSEELVYISTSSCWIFIKPSEFNFDGNKCKEFYIYYSLYPLASGSSLPFTNTVNGTIIKSENISVSPSKIFVNNYREKNIFVNETSNTGKIYNVSYKSDQIDYTGEL